MFFLRQKLTRYRSHSIRVSGLKLIWSWVFGMVYQSHSIRVSGLKYLLQGVDLMHLIVSLYTSEWIEMLWCWSCWWRCWCLTLYEWVDWNNFYNDRTACFLVSHSIRVSGLKLKGPTHQPQYFRLTLYEWVDWNTHDELSRTMSNRLTLYEWVDWNFLALH